MENSEKVRPDPILSLEGISKRFGPVWANRDISLDISQGEIHALLGENGAGKSTLMSILSGRYRPDQGRIRLKGKAVSFNSPAGALSIGIGMVYQRFMLVEPLSVAENIVLGSAGMLKSFDMGRINSEIESFSKEYGLYVDPGKKIHQLSMGERQKVEILKLLYRRAEILILDEPTAILSPPEIKPLFETLTRLAGSGRTIIFISHKLEEVMSLSDRISIMRRGKIIATLLPEQIRSKRELARLMVGREIVLKVDKEKFPVGKTVFAVKGLGYGGSDHHIPFDQIDLEVRTGEILAITGVAGNGQDTLVACLTGLLPFKKGSVTYKGRRFNSLEWIKTAKRDLVYIPEDRYGTASIPSQSLVENFMLTRVEEFGKGPLLDLKGARAETSGAIDHFGIKTPSGPSSKARQLSGGNLQKFILARELGRKPRLIIAEHPTQGLDVGATEEVWDSLLRQREHTAVILVSGDLKEVLSLADRIAVMFRGKILKVISTSDEEGVSQVGLLMAGVSERTDCGSI